MKRRILISLAALVAGLVLGHFLRDSPLARQNGNVAETVRRSPFESKNEQSVGSRPNRSRRQREEEITFSRLQWSKLLREPAKLRVSLLECIDFTRQLEASVPMENGVPLIGRLFEGKQKPDLKAQAAFFGWDEPQTRKVRQALVEFGDHLAEAEKLGFHVEYPDGGGVRFDFSESRTQREEVAAKLRESLAEILGPKDAERFAALSKMEGLAGDLPGFVEVKARSHVVDDLGHPLFIDGTGRLTTNYHDFAEAGEGLRVRHLDVDVRWDRLFPTAATPLKK